MKSELNLSVNAVNGELIIREGKALDLKEPIQVGVSGVIDSPLRWLEKRITEINQSACHIVVDREKLTIDLDIDETNFYGPAISGRLTLHPMFVLFGVNTNKYLSNFDMAKLFKMNRTAFETQAVGMSLVTELQNFRAKVDKEIQKQNDNRANTKELKEQAVTSNLPDKFNLSMPIFKGTKKQTFEVEVYINADDFSCTLISPTANDLIEYMRDQEIDTVLNQIRELAPGIVIIEK